MPRFALGAIEKPIFVSPSQEEALEVIIGWDDTHRAARVIDETPSEPAYVEISSESSLQRVFDVTGSSLCSGASQEPVDWGSPLDVSSPLSPMTAHDSALGEGEEEDSYNEAFDSDRCQSPTKTVSWSLPAAPHGCIDSRAPTTLNVVAVEDIEKPSVSSNLKLDIEKPTVSSNLKLMSEVEVPNRPIAVIPDATGMAIRLGTRLDAGQEATPAEEDAEGGCGRREGSPIHEAHGDGADGGSKTTADGEPRQHVSSIGIGLVYPQESCLPQGSPAFKPSHLVGKGFGSGSASAFVSLRRKEKDSSQPELSGEQQHAAFGLEGKSAANDSVLDTLDQITSSVQVNMQVVDQIVIEDDHSGKEVKSGVKFEKWCEAQHELDSLEKVGERGVGVEAIVAHSTVKQDESGTSSAAEQCQIGQEKSRESLLSPTSSKSVMDAAQLRSVEEPGFAAGASHQGGGQCSPRSPPRPPRAVQEKLDKLRSQSGSKRARSESFNLLKERVRTEPYMVPSSTVREIIRLRSGERPAANVTAADILRTALDRGITLPPPFHRNYFNR